MASQHIYSIGKLSKATGVKVETIRYYERIALLPSPPRTASGYRQYDQWHREQLSFIRRGRELGFSLDDIRSLLELQRGGMACAEVQRMARKQIAELKQRIDDLTRLRKQLMTLEAQCHGGEAVACPVVEALLGK